jgi:hypothetical protein
MEKHVQIPVRLVVKETVPLLMDAVLSVNQVFSETFATLHVTMKSTVSIVLNYVVIKM